MKNFVYFWCILLLYLPLNLFSTEYLPEWEKIEVNLDSLSWFGQVEANSKNELILLLSTGLYKSPKDNIRWTRMNLPDSLIFDNSYFQLNGPTIFTYAYTHNTSRSKSYYFVYSNDFGDTWSIFSSSELQFPGYDYSLFLFIDPNGEIWGISSNKLREPSSKVVVNKFDVKNQIATKMYEIPKSYNKILLNESMIVLLDLVSKPDLEVDSLEMKEIQVHYSNDGIVWDSLFFNKYNTNNFEFDDATFSVFSYIFEAKGSIYSYLGSQKTSKGSNLKIDLKNKILTILETNVSNSTYIKKVNDSCFYKSEIYKSEHWLPSIFRSNDMQNWEIFASPYKLIDLPDTVKYRQLDFFSSGYWETDSNENHYLYNNYGLVKLSNQDYDYSLLSREGLVNLSINNFAVDSKSNIVLVSKNHNENLIIVNPLESDKEIINHNYRIGTTDLFECLVNDTFIFDKYDSFNKSFATFLLNDEFKGYHQSKVNDTTRIRYIRNSMSRGMNYLGIAESGTQDNSVSYYAYTDDHCQTWTILDNYPFNQGSLDYQTFITKNLDIIRISPYAKFYISKNFSGDWEELFDDSTNVLFSNYSNSHKIDLINYNEANGTGIVKYQNRGPIYFTTDHGLSWINIDTTYQSFNFLHNYITKSKSDYSWVTLPMSFDSTFTFYINTPLGIYCSTDTLKTFKNITKGLIEPSYIYKFKAGNDGRLYAINSRGIWRTKDKLVNSSEDEIMNPFISTTSSSNIYPNPASDFITIPLASSSTNSRLISYVELKIFDVLGIEVLKESIPQSSDNYQLNIKNLSAGVYFIRIGNKVEKFIKL